MSDEVSVMEMEQRGQVIPLKLKINRDREESLKRAKPYKISKHVVWEAWELVKTNKGAAGVDAETIEIFGKNLKDYGGPVCLDHFPTGLSSDFGLFLVLGARPVRVERREGVARLEFHPHGV